MQIRAGVIEQARRVGGEHRHYAREAGREFENRMCALTAEHPSADEAGRSMRTADIVALFDTTAVRLIADD